MKRALLLVVGLLMSILLVACGNNNEPEELSAAEVKQKVTDYSGANLNDETASITSEKLIVTKNGKETSYDLPADEFFVSIAPYVEITHG